eukprot:11884741-Karenia_brevis.AAC.1
MAGPPVGAWSNVSRLAHFVDIMKGTVLGILRFVKAWHLVWLGLSTPGPRGMLCRLCVWKGEKVLLRPGSDMCVCSSIHIIACGALLPAHMML